MSTLLDELQSSPAAPDTPSPTLTDVINCFSDVTPPDDEPLRCRGFTKAGARCKLTADSVTRLHGRSVQSPRNHYVVHTCLSLIGPLVDEMSGRGISEPLLSSCKFRMGRPESALNQHSISNHTLLT